MKKTPVVSIGVLGIIAACLFFVLVNKQRISFFSPGYNSPDRITLRDNDLATIFSSVNMAKVTDQYSVYKILGEDNYAVIAATSSQQVFNSSQILFKIPRLSYYLTPQVYEQDKYVITKVIDGGRLSDFVIYNKENHFTTQASIPTDIDQVVSFEVYQNKLYALTQDVSSGSRPAIIYVYDFKSKSISEIRAHADYCNKMSFAISNGSLFTKESSSVVTISLNGITEDHSRKCFMYKKSVNDDSFVELITPVSEVSSGIVQPIQYANIVNYYSLYTVLYKTPGIKIDAQKSGGHADFLHPDIQNTGGSSPAGQIYFNDNLIMVRSYTLGELAHLSKNGLYYDEKQIFWGHVYFWKNDNVIVTYVGSDKSVVNVLTKIFGEPFIGK